MGSLCLCQGSQGHAFSGGKICGFLSRCKTERETVAHVEEALRAAGFEAGMKENGGFQTLYGKALFAVRRGKRPLSEGIRLISAHADSPRLDLKQRPLIEQVGVGQAKTHYYGGIHKYQWLARPLALHGVIVRENGKVIPVVLGEKQKEAVFTIADPSAPSGQRPFRKNRRGCL